MRRLILLLAIVALAAWGWQLAHQGPQLPVQGGAADASGVQQKTRAFLAAAVRARLTGSPVQVSEDFSDAELTSLGNEEAKARNLPVSDLSLHSTTRGVIEGVGRTQVQGQEFPVGFEGVPEVGPGNRLQIRVTNLRLGAIPIPGPVAEQVGAGRALGIGPPLTGFQQIRLTPEEGRLRVSAVAQPA